MRLIKLGIPRHRDRVYVVEVMGRHSGYIALYSGASSAGAILVPEVPFNLDKVCNQIIDANKKVSHTALLSQLKVLVLIENNTKIESHSMYIGNYIQQKTGYETRITILGHIQRGGAPTVRDRCLASRLAYHAVELIYQGESGKMIGEVDKVIKSWDLEYALAQKKQFNLEYYHLSNILSSI